MILRRDLLILPPIADAPRCLVVLCSKPIKLGSLLRGLLLERLCFDIGFRDAYNPNNGEGHTEISRFSLFFRELLLQSRDLVATVLFRFFLTSKSLSQSFKKNGTDGNNTDRLLERIDFLFDFSVFLLGVDEVQNDGKCAGEDE